MPAAILSVGEFVRRVVDGLLRGACRGKFLCSRCLVKLTRDHLDRRHPTRELALAIADLFRAPGRMTRLARSTCGACAGSTMPCLGVPVP
jgi:ferredoxin